ncbi:MAG: hypothetical protein AAF611_21195 [Bacteroidota bacterium]
MKTKIFLPVVAMLSLMLTSFTANANTLEDNICFSQEIEHVESIIFENPVMNTNELDFREVTRVRVSLLWGLIEVEVEFSSASGSSGGSGNSGGTLLEGSLEENQLIVRGFETRNGTVVKVRETQYFETPSGVLAVLPGAYEINDGKTVFDVEQSRG